MQQLAIGVVDSRSGSTAGNHTFRLPADFITQTASIIARKGAGKTYTGSVLAEQLLKIGEQVIVVDPLDVWWGLRSSADGKSSGFSIVVFGGEHGDLPLTELMGMQIADAIVEHRMSAVLSLDHLSKNGQRRFITDFAEQLYQKKNPSTARTPLHLFIDEADQFAPQRVQHGQERMLGSIDSLVRRGRTRGIGVTMITQRPATIHKDVFTQTEVLIALQLTSPQDRKAVDEWVQGNDTGGHRAEFMASLASLRVGQAWIWSPSWLGCFERVQIRERETFNSSSTPKAGEKAKTPKARAEVDLDALRVKLAHAIEESKANDPAVLRKEIATLKHELGEAIHRMGVAENARAAAYQSTPEDVQREVQNAVQGERERLLARAREAFKPLQEWLANLEWALSSKAAEAALSTTKAMRELMTAGRPRMTDSDVAAALKPEKRLPNGVKLARAERRILTALAQYHDGRSKTQTAILTGYSHKGGGFQNALSALRSSGFIASNGDSLRITDPGLIVLGTYERLPTGRALLNHWLGQLGKAERSVLEALAMVWPNGLAKADVAERAGYAADGGGFQNALSKLRTLELIERMPHDAGAVKITNHLMRDE